MSITDGKETDMRRLVNPGMEKALRRAQGDVGPIQALLKGLWRGDCLLAAYVAEEKYLRIRMQGRQCLPVFTSYEAAEAFQQMLLMRNGPALVMRSPSRRFWQPAARWQWTRVRKPAQCWRNPCFYRSWRPPSG